MDTIYFESFADLYAWLEANHATVQGLWVATYKKGSGRKGITYQEIVDALLCFGWIDNVRQTVDEESWRIRVTPRRRGSNWSAVNVRRMGELIEQGLVRPAGLREFEKREAGKAEQYSYERENAELPPHFAARFQEQPAAWDFFCAQPPSYRKAATWWVVSAKQETTRERRLAQLIEDSREGRRVKAVTYTKKQDATKKQDTGSG